MIDRDAKHGWVEYKTDWKIYIFSLPCLIRRTTHAAATSQSALLYGMFHAAAPAQHAAGFIGKVPENIWQGTVVKLEGSTQQLSTLT